MRGAPTLSAMNCLVCEHDLPDRAEIRGPDRQGVADGEFEVRVCGECGGEYEQPTMFPFKYCPHCGAPFADEDELLIELPFLV